MTRVAVILAVLLLLLAGCAARPGGPVTPVIDSAEITDGQLLASGTVSGVAEDGGLCQFTFWAENGEASRLTTTGVAAGDHSECPEVGEAATMLLPGSYELVLTYRSGAVVERSEPFDLVIP